MPIDIKTESLWYRNPDGTYTEFRAVAPAIDDELSENSEAPVQNKVITNALNKLSQDKQNKLTFDSTPTEESNNPVISQGIKAALDTKLDIPEEPGTPDQVLGLDENLIPHWTDKDNSEDYAPVLINSASGEIASFNDGAANRKIRKLDVHLSPIQDLHGYDSPWPAGGGKNLFGGVYGEHFTFATPIPSGSVISVSGSVPASGNTRCNLYDADGVRIQNFGINDTVSGRKVRNGWTLASDVYAVMFDVAEATDFQIELSSTYTSYSPYSNICPISGLDSVEVEADGVNLWHGQLGNNVNVPFHATPGKTYTVTAKKVDSSLSTYLLVQKLLNGTWVTVGYIISGSQARVITFTAEADMQYSLYSNASYTNVADIQIELGSTASAYETYQGTTYTIPLPETVYGGDIGVVSGDGESKMGMVDLGTLDWEKQTIGEKFNFRARISDFKPVENSEIANCLCTQYKTVSSVAITNVFPDCSIASRDITIPGVRVYDARYQEATAAEFKAAMSGVQLCYELATPTSLSTTPTEISTVEGQNNVFSPDGDVTVEYAADLKTYIDNKIAAAVAAMS